MKKYLVMAAASLLIFSFLSYIFYSDVRALENIKVEVNDVRVKKLLPDMVLSISIKLINDEGRKIEDLEGYMNIYILNESVGKINFSDVDMAAHSYAEIEVPLTLYYDEVAKGILKAIKNGNFNVTMKGSISGKILFGLMKYSVPIMARWERDFSSRE